MSTAQEKLLTALDLESLPPEEQEAFLADISDLVFEDSLTRMVEAMDQKTREDFGALMESDAEEDAVEAFLKERVPGADQAVADAMAELADAILSGTDTNHA